MTFTADGPAYAQSFGASEPGYGGSFTAKSSDTTVTVTDALQNYTTVQISVSIASFNLQSVRRRKTSTSHAQLYANQSIPDVPFLRVPVFVGFAQRTQTDSTCAM
jgi:hypothetical protein